MISGLKFLLVGVIKKVLGLLNVDPAFVKAIIKKPADVHGGAKAQRFPWPRRRHIGREERRAANRVLRKEAQKGGAMIYGGPEKAAYCKAFADYMGGGFVETVNSGTNAVYVALRALDLEPGTEVIVPSVTDPGGTMPVAMLNCIPVPADCEPGCLNTSASEIEKVLTERTSAIVVAHISGLPVDMDPIMELANERGIPIVEDCAQAHGAIYKGGMVGTFGKVSAFSTMFGKHHATGAQGGVVFTHDTMVFARARQVTDRGKPFGAVQPKGNIVASLNFNQDEISLAIGRVQLKRLPGFLDKRRSFANLVAQSTKDIAGVDLLLPPDDSVGSYWFLLFRLDLEVLSCSNAEFCAALEREGIGGVYQGYPFFPTDHPWHTDAIVYGSSQLPWALEKSTPRCFELPNAHLANKLLVRVDVHEQLGEKEAKSLATALKKIANYYSRT